MCLEIELKEFFRSVRYVRFELDLLITGTCRCRVALILETSRGRPAKAVPGRLARQLVK